MNIPSFEAKVRKRAGCAILDLSGDIDASAGQNLEEATSQGEVMEAPKLILDFTDVHYINSTGIALLVGLLSKALKRRQKVLACGLNEHYCEIFEITRLVDYMPVVRNMDEALAQQVA